MENATGVWKFEDLYKKINFSFNEIKNISGEILEKSISQMSLQRFPDDLKHNH